MGEEEGAADKLAVSRIYTMEEVREGLDAFGDAELSKLLRISRGLAPKADMEPEDLYQEAVHRMLTTRTCRIDVPLVAYVAGVMKSVASDAYRAKVKLAESGRGTIRQAANDSAEPASHELSPEDALIIKEHYRECLTRLGDLIAGDEDVELLVEGLAEGLRGKELEDLLGMDATELATVRKRLARTRSRLFPREKASKSTGGGA